MSTPVSGVPFAGEIGPYFDCDESILASSSHQELHALQLHPDIGVGGGFAIAADPELDAWTNFKHPDDAAAARYLLDRALLAVQRGVRGVSYSRRRDWYTSAARGDWAIPYVRMMRVINHLSLLGLIVEHRAKQRCQRDAAAEQSWFTLTPETLDWLIARGGVQGDRISLRGRPVRLKHRRKNELLLLPSTDFTRGLGKTVRTIDEGVQGAWLPNPQDVLEQRGNTLVVKNGRSGRAWLNMGATGFAQLLTETGDLKNWTGGRMFWPAQLAPRAVRRRGTIGGRPVAEIDFKNLHVRLALGPDDPRASSAQDQYEPLAVRTGEVRNHVKTAVNIGLNAMTWETAVNAVAYNIMIGDDVDWPQAAKRARQLLHAIKREFPSLQNSIGSDLGVKLMRVESDILRAACLDLARQRIPFVPLHDAIAVSDRHLGFAEEAMAKASWHVFGIPLPTSSQVAT